MNKKLIIGCIGVVFLFATMSIVSAINTNQVTEKKESPLFGIRTNGAIKERIGKINTNFIKRLFLTSQIPKIYNLENGPTLYCKGTIYETNDCDTCQCINQIQQPEASFILICTIDFTVPMCTCGVKHCRYN